MDTDITPRRARARTGRDRIVVSALKPKGWNLGKVPLDYVRSVRDAGADPVVVSTYPLSEDTVPARLEVAEEAPVDDTSWIQEASGLLLTGGGDVDPSFFGQARHPCTYNVMRRRDLFEFNLLEAALQRDLPVLAICRGMQLLNVHLGGTLDQHLTDDPERLDHDREVRGEPAHEIRVAGGELLRGILGSREIGVNSHHHQALAKVASPLKEVAWASDGVLEGVVSREHRWVVGVQWHPEAMSAMYPQQQALFDAFMAAAQDFAAANLRRGARSA